MKTNCITVLALSVMLLLSSCGTYYQYDGGRHPFAAPIRNDYRGGYGYTRHQTVAQTLVKLALITGSYVMVSAVENAAYTDGQYSYPVYCRNQSGNLYYYSINSEARGFPVYRWNDGRYHNYPDGPHSYYEPLYQRPAIESANETMNAISFGLGTSYH